MWFDQIWIPEKLIWFDPSNSDLIWYVVEWEQNNPVIEYILIQAYPFMHLYLNNLSSINHNFIYFLSTVSNFFRFCFSPLISSVFAWISFQFRVWNSRAVAISDLSSKILPSMSYNTRWFSIWSQNLVMMAKSL